MPEIEVTVKTLDSQNRTFTVESEILVKDFKEKIANDVGVAANTQRLIYCGRVLQDDKPLAEYDLHGKAVHLVQRAPPAVASQQPGTQSAPLNQEGPRPQPHVHFHQFRQRFQGPPNFPNNFPVGPSSLLRLNTARRMLQSASETLNRISGSEPTNEPDSSAPQEPDVPINTGTTVTMDMTVEGSFPVNVDLPVAQAATAAAIAAALSAAQAIGAHPPASQNQNQQQQQPEQPGSQPEQQPSERPSRNQGRPESRNPRVSVFADVIEDVERIQNDLRPHLTSVRQLLRDDPSFGEDREAARRAQHTFNRVSESLHYLSHAFHALSDLFVDWNLPPPREVRARPLVLQQTAVLSANIPVPAAAFGELRATQQQQAAQTERPSTVPQQPSQPPQQQQQQQQTSAAAPQQYPSPFGRVLMSPSFVRHPGGVGPMPRVSLPGGGNVATGAYVSPVMYMELRPQDGLEMNAMPFPPVMPQSSQFDPLLPCSSRHLPSQPPTAQRDQQQRAQQRPQAPHTDSSAASSQRADQQPGLDRTFSDFLSQIFNQPPQQQQPPQTGTQSSSEGDIFQLLMRNMSSDLSGALSGRQPGRTVGDIVRSMADPSAEAGESLFMDLFLTVIDHVSFADLLSIFFGQTSGLNNLQPVMSNFIRNRILDGGEFSEDSIRRGVNRLVDEVIPHLQNLASISTLAPDVHFAATIGHFLQQQLHDVIQLIAVPGENPNFGSLLASRVTQVFHQLTALILMCLSDGTAGLERIISSQIRSLTEGTTNPVLQQMAVHLSMERFRQLISRVDLNVLRPSLSSQVFNQTSGEAWMAERSRRGATAEAAVVDESSSQSAEQPQPMEVDVAESTTPRRNRLERLRSQATAAVPQEEQLESSTPVVFGSQEWHNAVPRDWVPNITLDIQRQNGPCPKPGPLSDAYLSNIPSKRRKMILESRPSSNPGQLVQDTLHRALLSANVTPAAAPEEIARAARDNSEVAVALRAATRPLGRRRLENDPDNDTELFPNANLFFRNDE